MKQLNGWLNSKRINQNMLNPFVLTYFVVTLISTICRQVIATAQNIVSLTSIQIHVESERERTPSGH
uniref:Uncharacterized protein n=1 Tax=Strigamia maritima TaxID=126957 RepID=T1J556_STRMM